MIAAKKSKAVKAPKDRESGTHAAAARAELTTAQLIARAVGSDGRVSMSAGAIEAMANELHHLTFRIAELEESFEGGQFRRSDLDELGEYIAQIAYRAQAVAKLERQLCEEKTINKEARAGTL